jgi:hypothetical protein
MDSNDMIKLKQKSQQDLNTGSKSGFNTERIRSNVQFEPIPENFQISRQNSRLDSPIRLDNQISLVKVELEDKEDEILGKGNTVDFVDSKGKDETLLPENLTAQTNLKSF